MYLQQSHQWLIQLQTALWGPWVQGPLELASREEVTEVYSLGRTGGALTQSKFLQELGPLHCAPGSDQSASLWRSVGKFCLASQRKKEQHKTNRWYDMKGLRWPCLLEGQLNLSSKGKLKTTAAERSPASHSPDSSVKIYRMTLLWQKWMTLPC